MVISTFLSFVFLNYCVNFSELACCQDCQAASNKQFMKELNPKNSTLVTCRQDVKDTEKSRLKVEPRINKSCQHISKCISCKTLVQRVRNLLDELDEVKGNKIKEICRYCKQLNISGKCKRCEYIFNKFFTRNFKDYEDKQKRFVIWLYKVQRLLQTVLDGETICMYNYKNSSAKELENILLDLKKPLTMRQPEIDYFLPEYNKLASLDSLSASKNMLNELIEKIKTNSVLNDFSSNNTFNITATKSGVRCICKDFMNDKFKDGNFPKPQHEEPKSELVEAFTNKLGYNPYNTNRTLENKLKTMKENKKNPKVKSSVLKENISPKVKKAESTIVKPKINKSSKKSNSPKALKASTEPKTPKSSKQKRISEEMLIASIRENRKEKSERQQKKNNDGENIKPSKFREYSVLQLNTKQSDIDETSESVLECGDDSLFKPLEMIKSDKIVPFNSHYRNEKSVGIKTLLFNVAPVFPDSPLEGSMSLATSNTCLEEYKSKQSQDTGPLKGVIKYELSNKEFIEKGWTQVPSEKIMRKMNIYKMIPANPQYDWFKRHQSKKIMYYESGEKLAHFNDDGSGKWYYRNGRVALEYRSAEELIAVQRYVVYSSGDEINNVKLPATVLACFDFAGNGVVYDQYGNIRLKYNQSEGIVVDSKIGPPGRWKWHTLNDPPVYQTVFIDTYLKHQDPCLVSVFTSQKEEQNIVDGKGCDNNEMLTIELENLVKEKAKNMFKKFKPFPFKVKVFKINEQFSLRILDQANIYLLYRIGAISLKLNLGMILVSNEIVGTEMTEISQVATPYDRNPPSSQSVADIQKILRNSEKIEKKRQAKQTRLKNL